MNSSKKNFPGAGPEEEKLGRVWPIQYTPGVNSFLQDTEGASQLVGKGKTETTQKLERANLCNTQRRAAEGTATRILHCRYINRLEGSPANNCDTSLQLGERPDPVRHRRSRRSNGRKVYGERGTTSSLYTIAVDKDAPLPYRVITILKESATFDELKKLQKKRGVMKREWQNSAGDTDAQKSEFDSFPKIQSPAKQKKPK